MSLYYNRPQNVINFGLTIGDKFARPQRLFPTGSPSPGVDTEIIEESAGIFDAMLYDQGTDAGFVLVQES